MAVNPLEIEGVKFTPNKVVDLDALEAQSAAKAAEEAAKPEDQNKGQADEPEPKVEETPVEENKAEEPSVEEKPAAEEPKVEDKKVETDKVDTKVDPDKLAFKVGDKDVTVTELINQNKSLSEKVAAIEGNDFLKQFNEHVLNGGDPREYLESQTVKWNEVPDLQVLRMKFDQEYSDLEKDVVDELFAQEIAKYNLSPEGTFEDENSKQAKVGKALLKRDADRIRTAKIDEQKKFEIPKRVEQKAAPVFDVEAEKKTLLSNQEIKSFMDSKLIKIADTEYGYEVQDPESVIGMMADTRKFWGSFQKDGKPDLVKLAKVMAFAQDPNKYDSDLLKLAQDIGQEKYLKEQKNVKDKVNKVVDMTKTDDDTFDPDEFLKAAIAQKRAKQKR